MVLYDTRAWYSIVQHLGHGTVCGIRYSVVQATRIQYST